MPGKKRRVEPKSVMSKPFRSFTCDRFGKGGHADYANNRQVIGLTDRPTGFHGPRWYFVSANGERAETLFLVEGFFRTRTEAGLTYRSQSQGELDRALDRRRKLQAQLEGTGARGPARGRRRKQAEEKLAEIQRLLAAFESGLVLQDQNSIRTPA